MKKLNIAAKTVSVMAFLAILLAPATMLADDTDFGDDVNDEPTAPISNYIYLGLVAGAGIGYKLLKRGQPAA